MVETNQEQWLRDRSSALFTALGGLFRRAGVDGEDLGWVEGSFTPTALAGGRDGSVPAGVLAVVLDAACVVAVECVDLAATIPGAITSMAIELDRGARTGDSYVLRGEVVGLTHLAGAVEATLVGSDGTLVARATGTVTRRQAT